MQQQQRGMTFLGVMILMAFVGIWVYAVIRLTPAYLEYMSIAKAFNVLKSETTGAFTAAQFRLSFEKRFEIEDVTALDPKDIEIKKEGDEWIVHGAWDVKEPFIGNVSFIVHFDKTVTLKVP